MRDQKQLSSLVGQLESEIESLRSNKDEASAQQWRIKRGQLAKAQYELFLMLEEQMPFIAVQLLWRSFEMGYRLAVDRISKSTSKTSSQVAQDELEKGDKKVLFLKGLQALCGIGMESDHELAFQYVRTSAEKGYAPAQTRFGSMYQNGRGVPQDDALAVYWYRLAAEQGHAVARTNLGWMYENGRGVPQDDALAVYWCRQAAEQGNAYAQYNLGWMYEWGQRVPQDDALAVYWYRLAAEQGHAAAQHNFGWMYDKGRGVPQDHALAVYWYRLAAEQGHAGAQSNLGWGYRNGRGLPQDDALAVYWYRLAAEQGDVVALNNFRWMYRNNQIRIHSDEAIEYRRDLKIRHVKEALAPLQQLAEAGDVNASYHLMMAQDQVNSKLPRTNPNEFFEALMLDPLLDEKTRDSWLEQLFNDHYRKKEFFESAEVYANRPKLNEENLTSVSIEVACARYARLSQVDEKQNTVIIDGKKTKRCVDVTTIKETKETIDKLILILNTIPENHHRYAEAQFILSHLHFMLDQKGEQWNQHLTACRNSDPEEKWVGSPNNLLNCGYLNTLTTLKAYQKAPLKVNSKEIRKALRRSEITIISENKYAFMPLVRLSLMTEKQEKRRNYLLSVKALDEDFSETIKCLDRLKNDEVISNETHKTIFDDINILRR